MNSQGKRESIFLTEIKKQASSLTSSKTNTVYFQPFGLKPKYRLPESPNMVTAN